MFVNPCLFCLLLECRFASLPDCLSVDPCVCLASGNLPSYLANPLDGYESVFPDVCPPVCASKTRTLYLPVCLSLRVCLSLSKFFLGFPRIRKPCTRPFFRLTLTFLQHRTLIPLGKRGVKVADSTRIKAVFARRQSFFVITIFLTD